MQRELVMQEKQLQINELESEHKRNRDEVYLLVLGILLLIGGMLINALSQSCFESKKYDQKKIAVQLFIGVRSKVLDL